MRSWISRNAINAVIVLALCVIFYKWLLAGKSYEEMGQAIFSVFLVMLGFGLLIFIHELGHFLAAKLCNVRVDAFSIGFGPPLPGCHFKYGETEYKLAWLPLGGYVKMPGEYPSETMDPEIANDPRTFMNQSVGERMFIISAGVVMNILLALVLFIYVYLAGKEEIVPRLGLISPGSPAAEAGMRAGSELLEVNGNTKLSYEDLFYATMFATPDVSSIHFKWRTPTGEVHEANVIPRKVRTDAKPIVGVGFPHGLQVPKHFDKKENVGQLGSPAAAAGLRPGDVLLGFRVAGAKEFEPLTNGYALVQAQYDHRGETLEFLVENAGQERIVTVQPRYFANTGMFMTMGPIVSVRDHRFTAESAQGFHRGDLILAFNGERVFDPLRLPDLVMDAAKTHETLAFTLRRDGQEVTVNVPSSAVQGRGTWNEERPIGVNALVSIPALGIAYEVTPTIVHVVPDSPAARAGLKAGDVIEAVGAYEPELEKTRFHQLADYSWPSVYWAHLAEGGERKVLLKVAGRDQPIELIATDDKTWPMADRGFIVDYERSVVQAEGVGEAIWMGFRDTGRWIGRIYMSLKGLVTRDIQAEKMLHGPVSIARGAFQLAGTNFTNFVMYLAMFSVNLAVVNFLPIPILDGGHMVFLVVEKLRGKPASERALIIANSVGLAIIASLMLFVLFLDVSKLTFFQKLWPWG